MSGHFAQYECAVRATQRAHAEAVEHAAIRKTPVAPGQEACEIGLEITRAQAIPGEDGMAAQQHASVPELRFLTALEREVRLDIGAPLIRERPRPRLDAQIKLRDPMNDRRR